MIVNWFAIIMLMLICYGFVNTLVFGSLLILLDNINKSEIRVKRAIIISFIVSSLIFILLIYGNSNNIFR